MGLYITKKSFAQQRKPSTKQKDNLLNGKRKKILANDTLNTGLIPKYIRKSEINTQN